MLFRTPTEPKKNNLFWYLLIPFLVFTTLFISLSPWFFEFLATPADRVFSGINRWSGDYYTYLSYVELGRRGEIQARLLATTMPQKPVLTHLAHTLPGFVLGKLLGFDSVASYHLIRALYGALFLYLTLIFFLKISEGKLIALLAFVFTFFISGFPQIVSMSPFRAERFLSWLQEQNIIGRPTGPLHYNAGFIFFILAFLWYFTSGKRHLLKKGIVFGILLNLLLLANPFAFLIFGLSFVVYGLIKMISAGRLSFLKKELPILVVSFLLASPLFLYNQYFLSQEPWGKLGVAPKFYVITHPPIGFAETILSIGPTFFLTVLAIFALAIGQMKLNFSRSQFVFLLSWLLLQFFLFFFGDFVKIDPLRSFNGLYYLPLSLFSAYLVKFVADNFRRKKTASVIIMLGLFIITSPNYYLSYKDQLFAFTDFKTFQSLSYPTKKQLEAFKFLENKTPTASGVLALYEASSLIIGFSGNSTEVNMDQAVKIPFFTNQMREDEAYKFLKNNHFSYVYFGYQEKSVGGDIKKYPFLKKIFGNEEVEIYKVDFKN